MADEVTPKPGEKPAETPAVEKPAETPAAVKPAETPAAKPGEAVKPAEPVELAEDAEPKPGERIVLSAEAFRKRMERATRAQLREQFGTDDPKVLKEKLGKLETYEQEREQARQAQLTKEQKLEEERAAAVARAEAAEAARDEEREERAASEADAELRSTLSEVFNPKHWKHVRTDLADHLMSEYGEEKLAAMNDSEREQVVHDWSKRYLEENPEFAAKKVEVAAKKEEPVAPAKVPVTNGVGNRGRRPEPLPTKFQGKTLKPGQPNSMTAAEVAEWKRASGNNY